MIELLVVVSILAVLAGLLLPGLAQGRQSARGIACLGQLRQMLIAAHTYAETHAEHFPIAYGSAERDGFRLSLAWDLTTIFDTPVRVIPGLLWSGEGMDRVQQCPSFRGAANWLVDPFTGYNYNTSYLGHGEFEAIPEPARITQIRHPDATAVFGDGQYAGGGNKFMRAPWPNPGDRTFRGRWAGTQGFRHRHRSNTAFADGHATPLSRSYAISSDDPARIAAGTGFLSPDNSLYDLE